MDCIWPGAAIGDFAIRTHSIAALQREADRQLLVPPIAGVGQKWTFSGCIYPVLDRGINPLTFLLVSAATLYRLESSGFLL